MDDHRKSERIQFREQVLVEDEGGGSMLGETQNISIGGTFVEGVAAPFGAPVVVHLSMYALRGVVRWQRDDGVGIQFGVVDAQDTNVLTEIVTRAKNVAP